jgi:hypothetical protein
VESVRERREAPANFIFEIRTGMDSMKLNELAIRYTAAWCSQNATKVASFYSEGGSLKINEGAPSIGRQAITSAAQDFMTAFPDMVVTMVRASARDLRNEIK